MVSVDFVLPSFCHLVFSSLNLFIFLSFCLSNCFLPFCIMVSLPTIFLSFLTILQLVLQSLFEGHNNGSFINSHD